MKNINLTDKELQTLGLKLVEAAPDAETIQVWIINNNVEVSAHYPDGTMRRHDAPLPKEVDG